MIVTTTPPTAWDAALDGFTRGAGTSGPEWVRDLRAAGLARFRETGFPGRKDEEWRFTNVAPIATGAFALADGAPSVDRAALEAAIVPGLTGPRLVFVDGRFVPELSRLDAPDGLTVTTLARAIAETPELVRPHLGRLVGIDEDPFVALNAAFLGDGAFVHVAKGRTVREPVHVVLASTAGSEATMAHPRNLFVVEDVAEGVMVEDWVSLGEGKALSNAVTEVVIGDGARAHHYVLARENDASYGISTVASEQGRDAWFGSHSALIGGALVRNNVYPTLAGTGGDSLLNGLYVPNGTQHHDTHMIVRHKSPHCESRQFYRGILDDRSHAVFSGRIIVYEDAQKIDAKQTDMNLLLSDDAIIDTKPQLEIYADDVKCTHGATVGQLDPDAVFYMKARGVPEATARGLLVFAFVNAVLERMELEPVREALAAEIAARLERNGSARNRG